MPVAWRPVVLRSNTRFRAELVEGPLVIDDPVPTEVIVAGMGLDVSVGGRDTDLMAGIVVNGENVVVDVGTLRCRVGVTVVDSRNVLVRIKDLSALFGLLVRDSTSVRVSIGAAHDWMPLDGEDQYPHVAYFQRSHGCSFSMREASMDGDGASEYGTALKAVLCQGLQVSGRKWRWPFGSHEFAGCENVTVVGGAYDGRDSSASWRGSHSSWLVRNWDVPGQPVVPSRHVRFRRCAWLAGDGTIGCAVMHSDQGPGLGVSEETTPSFYGCSIEIGTRPINSYDPVLPGLRVTERVA